MKPILQTCIPRPDIIAGSFNPEIFTASLSQVLDAYSGKGTSTDNIYTDAGLFFTQATFRRRVCGGLFGTCLVAFLVIIPSRPSTDWKLPLVVVRPIR